MNVGRVTGQIPGAGNVGSVEGFRALAYEILTCRNPRASERCAMGIGAARGAGWRQTQVHERRPSG